MLPELFRLGPIPINSYGTMVLIGVLCGLFLLYRGSVRRGWDPDASVDMAIWIVFAGIAGGRAFYVVQFWGEDPLFREQPLLGPLMIWRGGLVLFGAIFGGLFGLLLLVKIRRRPALEFLDVCAPTLAIGIAFGRLGCLLNGCCWGQVCQPDFPLAVTFPPSAPAGHTLPVQPTQLYASAAGFVICWICWRLGAHRPGAGSVMGTFAVLYGMTRFTLENIRGDHTPAPGAWPVSQYISVFVFLLGWGMIANAWRASRRGSPHDLTPKMA